MSGKTKIVGDVTREYCMKYAKAPSLQIARILKRDHPELFVDTEYARRKVRYYRGADGEKSRGQIERAGTGVPREEMPKAEAVDYAPVDLPDGRWLTLVDCHLPYHDEAAIARAVKYGKEEGVDSVLIGGDLLDFYDLSHFVKDPRKRKYVEELSLGRDFLSWLKQELKPKNMWWKFGNHELRLETYLFKRAPELLDAKEAFDIPGYMELASMGIRWVAAQNPIRRGHLDIVHGHERRGGTSAPVNPARTAFLKRRVCTLLGHHHVTSEHTGVDARGTTVTCWSVGCMCNLHPEYAPENEWNHGVAIIDARNDVWRVTNRRMVNGEVV